jgi:hypothetical protein
VPIFIIVFAASNFLGPVVLGRLFDTVGRKPMISISYLGSAVIAVVLAILITHKNLLGAWSFILIVMAAFFLASAGASAAYLTASEIFPMETRALAIAFFYAIGTAIGGITGPLLFGKLIASGSVDEVAVAFLIGAGVMAIGGIAELLFGVEAAGQQLEDIAQPLTVEDAEGKTPVEDGGKEGEPDEPDDSAESDQRIRERLERRRARDRAGMRRYRPGPGYGSRSPAIGSAAPPPEEALDTEIEVLVRALAEHGPTERHQLATLVGARYWGPGAFHAALRTAVADGEVQRTTRNTYRLTEHRHRASSTS